MSRGGEGAGVGVVAVLEPGSLARQSAKAPVPEQPLPADRQIAAQLIHHDKDNEPDLRLRRRRRLLDGAAAHPGAEARRETDAHHEKPSCFFAANADLLALR